MTRDETAVSNMLQDPITSKADAQAQSVDAPTKQVRRFIKKHTPAYALPALTVVIALFFSVWGKTSATFLTTANLQVLLGTQTVIAVVALGALIPLIANEWDLSVGACAGLATVTTAQLMSHGMNAILALMIGLLIGAAVGAINAAIVTRARVNAVIATLGMATILDGVVNQRTGGVSISSNIPLGLTNFGTGTWLGIPRTVYAVAVIAIAVHYVLNYTPFGRYLYALGSNPEAARLVGVRTKVIVAGAFLLAGTLAAAGGFLEVARAGGATPSVGDTFTLPALAAAFLSAASIKPGKANVGGTIVALVFLGVLNSGLNLAGAAAYISNYVNGAALISGIALAGWLARRQGAEA